MAVLPDPFSIFPKGVWARDYPRVLYLVNQLATLEPDSFHFRGSADRISDTLEAIGAAEQKESG